MFYLSFESDVAKQNRKTQPCKDGTERSLLLKCLLDMKVCVALAAGQESSAAGVSDRSSTHTRADPHHIPPGIHRLVTELLQILFVYGSFVSEEPNPAMIVPELGLSFNCPSFIRTLRWSHLNGSPQSIAALCTNLAINAIAIWS
jgi:hypothetical protein